MSIATPVPLIPANNLSDVLSAFVALANLGGVSAQGGEATDGGGGAAAIGAGATATSVIGGGAFAFGAGATAVDDDCGAIALGAASTAQDGTGGATAIGAGSAAYDTGGGATAIGAFASATDEGNGAVAIGKGISATDGQMVLGLSGNVYLTLEAPPEGVDTSVAIVTLGQGGLGAATFAEGEQISSVALTHASYSASLQATETGEAFVLSAGVGISQAAPFLTWIEMTGAESGGIGYAIGNTDASNAAFCGSITPGLYYEYVATPACSVVRLCADGVAQNNWGQAIHATIAGWEQTVDIEEWVSADGNVISGVAANAGFYMSALNVRGVQPGDEIMQAAAGPDNLSTSTMQPGDVWCDTTDGLNILKVFNGNPL